MALAAMLAIVAGAKESAATVIDDGVLRLDTEGTLYKTVTLNGGPFNESTLVQSFYFDDVFRSSHVLESST